MSVKLVAVVNLSIFNNNNNNNNKYGTDKNVRVSYQNWQMTGGWTVLTHTITHLTNLPSPIRHLYNENIYWNKKTTKVRKCENIFKSHSVERLRERETDRETQQWRKTHSTQIQFFWMYTCLIARYTTQATASTETGERTITTTTATTNNNNNKIER